MVKVPLNACDRNWVEGGVEHGGTPTPGESARLGSTSQKTEHDTTFQCSDLNHVRKGKYLGIFRVITLPRVPISSL